MKKLLSLLFILSVFNLHAADVDTVAVYSKSMDKYVKNVIILPDSYIDAQQSYNVLYLLHGAYGSYSDWISKVPKISDYADKYNLIIVCPDGAQFGWYLDSPIDAKYQYETYCSKELIAYIDKIYRTKATKDSRAITGLSMGGHGALSLAIKHQDVWGVVGSMSGALNIDLIKNDYELGKRLGDYAKQPERWKQNAVYYLVEELKNGKLKIIFDCGVDDFLYQINLETHQKLLERRIEHTFMVRPGAHNWDYWAKSIAYHLVFFDNYFHQ